MVPPRRREPNHQVQPPLLDLLRHRRRLVPAKDPGGHGQLRHPPPERQTLHHHPEEGERQPLNLHPVTYPRDAGTLAAPCVAGVFCILRENKNNILKQSTGIAEDAEECDFLFTTSSSHQSRASALQTDRAPLLATDPLLETQPQADSATPHTR